MKGVLYGITYCSDIDTVGDGALLRAADKQVNRLLLVLGLVVLDDLAHRLGVGANGQSADEILAVLVRLKVLGHDVGGRLGLGLLLLLLLGHNGIGNLLEALVELVLGERGDDQLAELLRDSLDLGLLLGAKGEAVELVQLLLKQLSLALDLVSRLARVGNDATDALGDAALLDNDEVLDQACLVDVSAATELDTVFSPLGLLGVGEQGVDIHANGNDSHWVGVSLAEHGTKALNLQSTIQLHVFGVDLGVGADILVGELLNLPQLIQLDLGLVRKVETQLLIVDQRALLVDIVAQHLPQRVVQDVCAGVVVADGGAAQLIVFANDFVAGRELSVLNVAAVEDVSTVVLDVHDLELDNVVNHDAASVGDLATGLGVEVGLIEQDTDGSVCRNVLGRLEEGLAVKDVLNLALAVALEVLGIVVRPGNLEVGVELRNLVDVELGKCLHGILDSFAGLSGLFTGNSNLGLVNLQASLLGHQLGQVDGEAKRVVESPHDVSVQLLDVVLGSLGRISLELGLTAVQSAGEGLLFLVEDLLDVRLLLGKIRELLTHLRNKGRQNLGEEGADFGIQILAGVSDTTSENSSNDIAAAIVVGHSTVRDGKGHGSDVVCDNSVGGINTICVVGAVLVGIGSGASNLLNLLEERREAIGGIVGGGVLQRRDQTLEAHTGIDVLGRQGLEASVLLSVELHENEVPDLDNHGIVHVDETGSIASSNLVVVYLTARTAGTLVTHLPEVVLHVSRQDLVFGHAHRFPKLLGFQIGLEVEGRVALKVRDVEASRVEAIDLGEQLPGHLDGILLEVVAEGPVAQHLEKGMVVTVLADIVEIVVFATGADDLLGVDGALEV
ncbi:hypothetical protein CCMA1212_009972 [Trichoderma ghanense]|uniref:NAD-specific glutamate dehydrogenase n=1 Tax=Trichoderma ghanense TaxID=65468 RepID=A0ABY2GQT2_9HYPO